VDVAARTAIEAILVGLAEAKVIGFDQLATILRSIEEAGASAGVNIEAVENDLDQLVDNVRVLTGCYPVPVQRNPS
jgi:hypothetical protein